MRHIALLSLTSLLLTACQRPDSGETGGSGGGNGVIVTGTTVSVRSSSATTVYVAFGADSAITADDWSFCSGSGLTCSFPLDGVQRLPIEGAHLNATFAFGQPVGCGVTKAEVNVNNPNWYDILDVSLVDGYSNDILISVFETGDLSPTPIGPPKGASGNEHVFGVFPLGCDLCVQRGDPPCGIEPGPLHGDGCKLKGTQYDPDPPCQWQGSTKGGDSAVVIELVQ
jgi:hypothetical protein